MNTIHTTKQRHIALRKSSKCPLSGESTAQLAHRVFGLVDELKEKYADKSVLLVCHGGVCRMVHMYFHYLDNEGFNAYRIPNAGVHFYDTQALGAQEEKNHETQL